MNGWRESNPQERCGTALENETFSVGQDGLAADWQRLRRHCETGIVRDTDTMSGLSAVVTAWLQLPKATQQIIVALVQTTLK
jgi:hypothetical protein